MLYHHDGQTAEALTLLLCCSVREQHVRHDVVLVATYRHAHNTSNPQSASTREVCMASVQTGSVAKNHCLQQTAVSHHTQGETVEILSFVIQPHNV